MRLIELSDRLRHPIVEVQMTIARHPKTAISTTPRRLLARRRDFAELRVRTDAEQSVGCVDPGPSGFDFSEDEAKHVLKGQSRS